MAQLHGEAIRGYTAYSAKAADPSVVGDPLEAPPRPGSDIQAVGFDVQSAITSSALPVLTRTVRGDAVHARRASRGTVRALVQRRDERAVTAQPRTGRVRRPEAWSRPGRRVHKRIRNRLMLALSYDSALRREELCALRTDDLDPAHRTLRVRAETTKTRRGRVVPYSAATGVLLSGYLAHRAGISRARGPLFLSESRRNHGEPLSLWTWSKVVRRVALAADVPQFSTHTTRHLCLTDLARMGWELHAIATFAGHRSTESTLTYIHLSGRDLAEKLNRSMTHLHAQRIAMLTAVDGDGTGPA